MQCHRTRIKTKGSNPGAMPENPKQKKKVSNPGAMSENPKQKERSNLCTMPEIPNLKEGIESRRDVGEPEIKK